MGSLGTFGKKRDQIIDTFSYFDLQIRINPDLSELDILDFMEVAFTVEETDPSAILVVKKFLRSMIHPDDFESFWQTARVNRQRIEDIQAVTKAIIEAVTSRPTRQPSDSLAGRRSTRMKSKGGSSARVLSRLAGRPDLQLAVVRAQEAQLAG